MTTITYSPSTNAFRRYWQQHPLVVLLLILLVGILPRMYFLPGQGYGGDQHYMYQWANCGYEFGIFGVYRCPVITNHPPVGLVLLTASYTVFKALGMNTSTFEFNAPLLAALKMPGLLFEIALVWLAFRLTRRRAGVGWAGLVAAALYWNPGMMLVTAWWGQTDAICSFFLLLTAYFLSERRPRWMWVVYALAWLVKFQSVMILPVLGILSLRRFGFRATLSGGAIFAAVLALGLLPFVIGSGSVALAPYASAYDLWPSTTNNAYNLWYAATGPAEINDSLPLWGSVTSFQVGAILTVIATTLLCARAWFGKHEDRDGLLLAAMAFSFVMLMTQMHERYLFPALVLLAVGMIRDWRLVLLFAAASLLFTDNIIDQVWWIEPITQLGMALSWDPVYSALGLTAIYLGVMSIALALTKPHEWGMERKHGEG